MKFNWAHDMIIYFVRGYGSYHAFGSISNFYWSGAIRSLQNKIWNLPDRSTILRKFIYDKEGKLAKSCRTDPNFAGQCPRSGTYFEDCIRLIVFFIVIQFQWKFHFPMIKIPLNWSLPISAHHIIQDIVVACSVMWYSDKSKCLWNVNCDWKIVRETNPWTGYPYRGTALSWKLNWKIPHISAFL